MSRFQLQIYDFEESLWKMPWQGIYEEHFPESFSTNLTLILQMRKLNFQNKLIKSGTSLSLRSPFVFRHSSINSSGQNYKPFKLIDFEQEKFKLIYERSSIKSISYLFAVDKISTGAFITYFGALFAFLDISSSINYVIGVVIGLTTVIVKFNKNLFKGSIAKRICIGNEGDKLLITLDSSFKNKEWKDFSLIQSYPSLNLLRKEVHFILPLTKIISIRFHKFDNSLFKVIQGTPILDRKKAELKFRMDFEKEGSSYYKDEIMEITFSHNNKECKFFIFFQINSLSEYQDYLVAIGKGRKLIMK